MTYHAIPSSASIANPFNIKLTAPGSKYVPIPGCKTGGACWTIERFDQDGAKALLDSETDLIVGNLFHRMKFVEETVELNDIRVLVFSARQHGRDRKDPTGD